MKGVPKGVPSGVHHGAFLKSVPVISIFKGSSLTILVFGKELAQLDLSRPYYD